MSDADVPLTAAEYVLLMGQDSPAECLRAGLVEAVGRGVVDLVSRRVVTRFRTREAVSATAGPASTAVLPPPLAVVARAVAAARPVPGENGLPALDDVVVRLLDTPGLDYVRDVVRQTLLSRGPTEQAPARRLPPLHQATSDGRSSLGRARDRLRAARDFLDTYLDTDLRPDSESVITTVLGTLGSAEALLFVDRDLLAAVQDVARLEDRVLSAHPTTLPGRLLLDRLTPENLHAIDTAIDRAAAQGGDGASRGSRSASAVVR